MRILIFLSKIWAKKVRIIWQNPVPFPMDGAGISAQDHFLERFPHLRLFITECAPRACAVLCTPWAGVSGTKGNGSTALVSRSFPGAHWQS